MSVVMIVPFVWDSGKVFRPRELRSKGTGDWTAHDGTGVGSRGAGVLSVANSGANVDSKSIHVSRIIEDTRVQHHTLMETVVTIAEYWT